MMTNLKLTLKAQSPGAPRSGEQQRDKPNVEHLRALTAAMGLCTYSTFTPA